MGLLMELLSCPGPGLMGVVQEDDLPVEFCRLY